MCGAPGSCDNLRGRSCRSPLPLQGCSAARGELTLTAVLESASDDSIPATARAPATRDQSVAKAADFREGLSTRCVSCFFAAVLLAFTLRLSPHQRLTNGGRRARRALDGVRTGWTVQPRSPSQLQRTILKSKRLSGWQTFDAPRPPPLGLARAHRRRPADRSSRRRACPNSHHAVLQNYHRPGAVGHGPVRGRCQR